MGFKKRTCVLCRVENKQRINFSGITFLTPFGSDPAKESLYLEVRRREGRVHSDEIVKKLPEISADHPNAAEWKFRKRTLDRLKKHPPTGTPLRILDLGCGNGWMANRLAENPLWEVWAVDLNREELEQGARLFGREQLKFIYADVLQDVLPEKHFDVIVLAASIQYFPDLHELFEKLRKLLNSDGEIHIIDAPVYKNEVERTAAKQRTLHYYTKVGVPEMADYYHHHLLAEIKDLGAKNLNDNLIVRFLQQIKWLAPFPWLYFR